MTAIYIIQSIHLLLKFLKKVFPINVLLNRRWNIFFNSQMMRCGGQVGSCVVLTRFCSISWRRYIARLCKFPMRRLTFDGWQSRSTRRVSECPPHIPMIPFISSYTVTAKTSSIAWLYFKLLTRLLELYSAMHTEATPELSSSRLLPSKTKWKTENDIHASATISLIKRN